jgi:thiol:disulfide interchange protein DsbD
MHPVKAELLPGGRTPDGSLLVGVRFRMDAGWHIYWKNPGDAGMPVTVNWRLPEGYSAGLLQYPVPLRFESQGLTGFGYRDEVVLVSRIEPDRKHLQDSSASIRAEVSWLACRDSCLPGADTLDIPVRTLLLENDPAVSRFLRKMPKPVDEGPLRIETVSREKSKTGSVVVVRFDSPPSGQLVDFFPDPGIKGILAGEIAVRGSSIFIPFKDVVPDSIGGVIASADGGFSVSRSVASGPFAWPKIREVLIMLLLAFAGGMLLNIMPCVLPVIGLKVFSLIGPQGQDQARGKLLSLVFAGGVVISFWALALFVFVLKGMGEQIGWGFQFQSPWFVLLMASVVFAFALNLFDVYELNAPVIRGPVGTMASHHGLSGAFISGVLATTLATPCTAPFLGTALGFAFTQPASMIFVFFTVIASGMALPYVVLAWHPSWLKLLPKPGNWMYRFKQAMGFVLFSVVVWLCSIFEKQSGGEALARFLIFLFFLAVLLWLAGILAGYGTSWQRRVSVWLTILLASSGAFVVLFGRDFSQDKAAAVNGRRYAVSDESGIPWTGYTPETYRRALASGKTVFLEFTADWCLTCKVLEATVLNQERIIRKLKGDSIISLKADWTSRDDAITALLKEFDRSGVPLLVIIPQGDLSRVVVLPEVVTVDMLASALDMAGGTGK